MPILSFLIPVESSTFSSSSSLIKNTLYLPNLDTALLLPPSSFLDGEEEPLIVDFLRAQYASAFTKLPKWLPMVQNSPCCQDRGTPPLKESMNVIATEEGFAMDDIKGKKTNPILDSVYFCIVTMTTVGYGDLVPNSALVKLLACVFVFMGMALVGLILSKAADYLVDKQEILMIKALHMHEKPGPAASLKETETSKVKYKCYLALAILSVLMLVGTVFLYMVEDLDIIDAFYCVCCTITTLGYGDKSFSTGGGRLFALFWMLTELFTESRQRTLVHWVLTRKTTNLDLEAADIDDDGVVGAAEFILYKLKEMGKISQEDIALVMEEFEDLDVDQSGTLSDSDITSAQSTQMKK
ncbi:two-pore potassium channel 1-like [Populus alba x Populus x berolinensis]|nr:two-pore potassium channel 1-like [Populus alba x Populus x berolinensis]